MEQIATTPAVTAKPAPATAPKPVPASAATKSIPAIQKAHGPSLNTSMLEAKLSDAKKSTPSTATPNQLGVLANIIKSNAKQPGAKPTTNNGSSVGQSPKLTETGPSGIALKGSAQAAIVNAAAKANGTLTGASGKPMSVLRSAALASLKAQLHPKAPDAKAAAKPPVATQVTKAANNQGPVKQGKQATTPHGSPNPNNKQAAAKSPAGTGSDNLANIKILTFEEIMAQKRAKKEAEKAAAAASTQSPKRPQTPIASPVSTPKTTPPQTVATLEKTDTTVEASNAYLKPAGSGSPKAATAVGGILASTTNRPAGTLKANVTTDKTLVSKLVTAATPVANRNVTERKMPFVNNTAASAAAPAAASAPAIGNSHIGIKRSREPSDQALPLAKKPAVQVSSVAKVATVVESAQTPIITSTPPLEKPQNSSIGVDAAAPPIIETANGSSPVGVKRPRELSDEAGPLVKKPAVQASAAVVPPMVKSEQAQTITSTPPMKQLPKQSVQAEEAVNQPNQSIEKKESTVNGSGNNDDELAEFEAEFGDLDDLDNGDIKDFDEESILKELEELENV